MSIVDAPASHVVGTTKNVRIEVRNVGNAPALSGYQVTLTYARETGTGGSGPLAEGVQYNPIVGTTLATGASQTHDIPWRATATQNGTINIQAHVTTSAPSDPNSANDIAHRQAFVHLPDVRVERTWPDNAEYRARPEVPLNLTVTLRNNGNALDTLVLSMSGESKLAERGWRAEFPTKEFLLGPGAETTATVRFTPDRNAPAGNTVDGAVDGVKIQVASKANPTDYTNGVNLPKLIVSQIHRLELRGPAFPVAVTPGEPATLQYTLENKGNGADTVSLDVTGALREEAWGRGFPGTTDGNLTVPAGTTTTVTLSFTPPLHHPAGSLTFLLKAQSRDGDGNAQWETPLLVRQYHLLHATATDTELPSIPGSVTSFRLNITNRGNGQDTMQLSVIQDEERYRIPAGWRITFERDNVILPGNTTEVIRVNVTVPAGTDADTRVNLKARVRSLGSQSGNATDLIMSTYVIEAARANLHFEPPASPYIDPEEIRVFPITVDSVGNIEGSFQLSAEVRAIKTSDSWSNPSIDDTTLRLARLQSATTEMRVAAPAGAGVGDKVAVTLTLKDPNGRTLATRTFDLIVSGPDLALTGLRIEPPAAVYSGDAVNLSAALTNAGNEEAEGAIEVRFYRIQGAERQLVGTVTIPDGLGPGRSATPAVALDTRNLRDAYSFLAIVDEGGSVVELDEDNNQDATSALVRRYAVTVAGPANQTAIPGQAVAFASPPYALDLQNLGNAEETLRVRIVSEHGWVSADQRDQVITLGVGERRILNFTVNVPNEPGANLDTLTFHVENALRPDLAATLAASVSVKDEAPPVFVGEMTLDAPVVSIKETVSLTATIRDAFRVTKVTARVEYPNREKIDFPLTSLGGNQWNLNASFNLVGNYNVSLEAEDATGNKAGAKGPAFRVVAGSAPTVMRLDDNRTVIRAGYPIPLSVEDPLGVQSVTVTLDGNTRNETPLAAPYLIDTTQLAAGEHKLEVRARNLYAETTSFPITVTVDNTPPRVRKVDVPVARPGEEITLTVTFQEHDLHDVTALITHDGAEVEHNMTDEGNGVWSLVFTPEAGSYRFNVRAVDAAGNVGSLDAARSIDVEAEGFFARLVPSAQVLGVVAALAVAVLVRRR